jgi:hypothetical protein
VYRTVLLTAFLVLALTVPAAPANPAPAVAPNRFPA